MGYKPSLNDIPQQSSGYQPSLADIPKDNDVTNLLQNALHSQELPPVHKINTILGNMQTNSYRAPMESSQAITNPEDVSSMASLAAGTPSGLFGLENPLRNAMNAPGNIVKGTYNIGKNAFSDLSPLEQQEAAAQEAHAQAKNAEQTAQQSAQLSGLPGSTIALKAQHLDNQQKLQELQQSLTDKPPTLPANVEDAKYNMDKAQADHEKATQLATDADKQISEHLNKGAAHDVRAAQRIDEIQNAKKKEIGNGFKQLEHDFEQRNVAIDNTDAIQQKNEELMALIKNNSARSPEANQILQELEELKANKPVNAKDYLRSYQSVSQFAREAREKAYQPGMNAEERHQWKQTYDELDNKVDEMGRTLEESVGPEDYKKLRDLRSRWRDEVVPLYNNRTYQMLHNKEQMPDDIIKSLRGNEKGNVLLKNIIKNDPETLKNVVGQRYAEKPGKLSDAGEITQEYLDHMPDLNRMVKHRELANTARDEAKANLEQAQNTHQEVTKNSGEYSAKRAQIQEIQDKMPLLEQHIAELEKLAGRKDIALGQKIKAEKQLAAAREAKRSAQKKLWRIGKYSAYGFGLGYGGTRIAQSLKDTLSENQKTGEE